MAAATDYFDLVTAEEFEKAVVVCKECKHGVWPDTVRSHLNGKRHRIPRTEAAQIQDQVEEWPGVAKSRSDFAMPSCILQPITAIPLHTDGFKCTKDPTRCFYICRDANVMAKHWRTVHQWSVSGRRGGSGLSKKQAVKGAFKAACREHVHCQRLFVNRDHSGYFEVQQPEAVTAAQAYPSTSERALTRAWDRARAYWNDLEKQQNNQIKPSEVDEANP
jgi:hypothetical protein